MSTPKLKTFLVEDSQVIRDSLIATLEELAPVKVVGTAAGQTEALASLLDPLKLFDLVIVDIHLQNGSGLGVLHALRHMQATSGLARTYKVVVLSNFASRNMRRTCLELGVNRVFDKSDEIDALIQYCIRAASDGSVSEPAVLA